MPGLFSWSNSVQTMCQDLGLNLFLKQRNSFAMVALEFAADLTTESWGKLMQEYCIAHAHLHVG